MLNTTENEPLGELVRKGHRYVSPFIDCYNINKKLESHIRKTYFNPLGIDCSMIYPKDQDSQNLQKWFASFPKIYDDYLFNIFMPSFMRKIPFVYPQRLNCMWAEKHFPENWKGIYVQGK